MIQNLDIYLWNMKVGSLVAYKEKYNDKACFYFDNEFIKKGIDIAPLRASIQSVSVKMGLPVYADNDKIFGGLPSFIADSMPDHWGNIVFNEWAKSKKIPIRNLTALDRLAYIGRRGMGALEYLPPMAEDMEEAFKVEIVELYKLSQATLEETKKINGIFLSDLMIDSLFRVGTSAGGRRPKALINFNPDTHECYSGQVAPPNPDLIPMIIKFDEHLEMPTTRIEYSYYLMTKEVGLKMMPSRLIEGKSYAHFITERFDRKGNKKIHTQTLAAMNPIADSYEDLFDVAYKLNCNHEELSQLFLLMTMNVLGGNIDDHNKNFSFMMAEDGIWHITPAYDFTFSVDNSLPGYMNKHSLTVNNKNCNFEMSDLLQIAKRYNIKCAETIIQNAITVLENYRQFAERAGVCDHWIKIITSEINRCIENL